MTPRSRAAGLAESITALVRSPELHALAELLPARPETGRPRTRPGWSVLLLGALARHVRSTVRAQTELASAPIWEHLCAEARRARAELGLPVEPPTAPPSWGAWACARDRHLATEEGLAEVAAIHLEQAVRVANQLGLCLPDGGGSWSHPAKTRTAYGDGTLVRPMYSPPLAVRLQSPDGSVQIRYPAPGTGELLEVPPHRYDPDAAEHHGKSGPVHATNYVAWHVRGPAYYQRVILTVGRVETPGREADAAVRLLRDVRRAVGDGLQAVVYDGALRGVHIEDIQRNCGYVVLSKPATIDPGEAPTSVRLPTGRAARSYPLGTWTHDPPGSPGCLHMLAAVGGAVCEIGLDETGDPLVLAGLDRRQIKRPRRGDGRFHFSVGYEVPCAHETFWVWVSPHAERGDDGARRAENVRIIAPSDPDGQRLYGLRSDAESHHYHYKRTLLVGRAMSKGWRRGLLDQFCFALLHNALVSHRAAAAAPAGQPLRRRAPA